MYVQHTVNNPLLEIYSWRLSQLDSIQLHSAEAQFLLVMVSGINSIFLNSPQVNNFF